MAQLLFLTSAVIDSGVHRRARIGMIRFLVELGFEVTVVAPRINSKHPIEDEVDIHWADWNQLPMMETYSKLRGIKRVLKALLTKKTFDVAMVDTISAEVLIKAMRRHGSFPFFFDERSPPVYDHLSGRLQWLMTNRRWKKCAPKAVACLVQSDAHADFIRERYGLVGLDFIIYRNSVNIDDFTPANNHKERIAVYTGTLRRERGVEDLIEAGRLVNDAGQKISIQLYGTGPMDQWISKLASTEKWLEYHGWVSDDELKQALGRAMIGVIPHPDRLGWRICAPTKLLEYAASGMIVLARNLPSHQEIGPQDWFHLVSSEDGPEKIAEGLIQILESGDSDTLCAAARTYAEEEMTFEARTREFAKHLQTYL